jgi:hypothetical protein
VTPFDALLLGANIVSGAIASATGFGIGSILTPLLATQAGTQLAVGVWGSWMSRTPKKELSWGLSPVHE